MYNFLTSKKLEGPTALDRVTEQTFAWHSSLDVGSVHGHGCPGILSRGPRQSQHHFEATSQCTQRCNRLGTASFLVFALTTWPRYFKILYYTGSAKPCRNPPRNRLSTKSVPKFRETKSPKSQGGSLQAATNSTSIFSCGEAEQL